MTGMMPALKRHRATSAATARTDREEVGRPGEALRPEHVPREEHREVHDHAHDRRRDPGERRGEADVAVRRLDERRADQDEHERGQEREERRDRRAGHARSEERLGDRTAPCVHAPTKPTNATTMISGPGVVSPSASPSIIWRRGEPAVVLDGALVHVREDGIRAAEGQQRRLGEEPTDLRERALPAVGARERTQRGEPDREPDDREYDDLRRAEPGVRQHRAVVDQRRSDRLRRRPVAAAPEPLRARGDPRSRR